MNMIFQYYKYFIWLTILKISNAYDSAKLRRLVNIFLNNIDQKTSRQKREAETPYMNRYIFFSNKDQNNQNNKKLFFAQCLPKNIISFANEIPICDVSHLLVMVMWG